MSRKFLRGATAVLLLAAGAVIGLIALGVFDPQPPGEAQWRQEPPALTVPAGVREVMWLQRPLPADHYAVHLTAAHAAGEPDSLYGLALGTDADGLVVAVSPLGYVSIWQQAPLAVNRQPSSVIRQPTSDYGSRNTEYGIRNTEYGPRNTDHGPRTTEHIPFQPWPHVRTGAQPNEIWVDVAGGQVTVRVNRELLWSGRVAVPQGQIGILGESFGQVAVIQFEAVTLFAERP